MNQKISKDFKKENIKNHKHSKLAYVTNLDVDKLKSELNELVKMSDPYERWISILNELKPQLEDAKSKGISMTKIQKTLQNAGAKIPQQVLKKFLN